MVKRPEQQEASSREAPGKTAGPSGYVLVEAAIALCVVTAAFVGVFALAHQVLRVSDSMKNELYAAQVAESELERLRALPWERLAAQEPTRALDPATTPGLAEVSGGTGSVRVQPVEGGGNEGLRAVSVRIAWVGRDGRAKELAVATLMADRGKERP